MFFGTAIPPREESGGGNRPSLKVGTCMRPGLGGADDVYSREGRTLRIPVINAFGVTCDECRGLTVGVESPATIVGGEALRGVEGQA